MDEKRAGRRTAPDTGQPPAVPDPTLLESEVGREFRQGAIPEGNSADDIIKPIGATRRGAETNVHTAGAGDEETEDGLDPTEEALRSAAEDQPDTVDIDDVPVFDRGDTPPRP